MLKSSVNFQSKPPEFSNSIFTVMTQLANDYNALNLSQGFPDFNCSKKLVKQVNDYIIQGENQVLVLI